MPYHNFKMWLRELELWNLRTSNYTLRGCFNLTWTQKTVFRLREIIIFSGTRVQPRIGSGLTGIVAKKMTDDQDVIFADLVYKCSPARIQTRSRLREMSYLTMIIAAEERIFVMKFTSVNKPQNNNKMPATGNTRLFMIIPPGV